MKYFFDFCNKTSSLHENCIADLTSILKLKNVTKNFGNTFPFWDLVFGTYYNRKGVVEKVGVVESYETNYPKDKEYFKQLIFPIRTSKDCCK